MSHSVAKWWSNKLWFWISCSQGSVQCHGGCGSSPTTGARRRVGGCQSRTSFPPALNNHPAHFSTACNAKSSQKPVLRTAAALRTPSCHPAKQRLGLCQPCSAGPAPICCGLTSCNAVHWVPPQHAEINKVTCTNTPCLSSSLPPALTLFKYDCYVSTHIPCSNTPVLAFLLAKQRCPCTAIKTNPKKWSCSW